MAVVTGHPGEGKSARQNQKLRKQAGVAWERGHWTSQSNHLACPPPRKEGLWGSILMGHTFLTFPAGPQRPFHPSLSPVPGAYPRVPGGPETPQASLCAYHGDEQTCLSKDLPFCCPAEPPSGGAPNTMAGSPLWAMQLYLAEPPVKAIHTCSTFRHWS